MLHDFKFVGADRLLDDFKGYISVCAVRPDSVQSM